jgi:hypothetical protein
MSGQSVLDRVQAARHSVMGQQIAKKVCKATTEELLAPKRKHLEDLLQYTHDPNVNVADIIDYILSRTHNNNWVVVFKSLITLHHLMCYGNEKIIQSMASRTMELNLANYCDRKDMMGTQMSPFIQRYSKYLSTKAGSYRSVAFDFCNAKRGKEEGKLRNMGVDELLIALPALADQLEALLSFQARPTELQNGIIVASFMLLFKDSIRLFACYNEGIINLLEKFFDMNKKQCEEALKDYKTFLKQMENVGAFLKTAEEYGIDKGDIPDLTSAPNSLLEALESHYQSLEGDKKSTKKQGEKKMALPKQLSVNAEAFAAVSQKPQSTNPFFFDESENVGFSEQERQRALEEENQQLSKFAAAKQTPGATNPFAAAPVSTESAAAAPSKAKDLFDPFDDLLGGGASSTAMPPPSSDPFGGSSSGSQPNSFSGAFTATIPQNASNPFLQQQPATSPFQMPYGSTAIPQSTWMNGYGQPRPMMGVGFQQPHMAFNGAPPVAMFPSPQNNTVNFDSAFSSQPAPTSNGMAAGVFGDVMQPTVMGGGGPMPPMHNPAQPLMAQQRVPQKSAPAPGLGNDLDSAIANLSMTLGTKTTSAGTAW